MCLNDFPAPSRRDLIRMGAVGALTLVGLGKTLEGFVWAQGATQYISTPALTEGPYWIDETGAGFFRSDVRTNIGDSAIMPGLPLRLGLTISQLKNGVITPLPNAYVYIWHCSAAGLYSGEEANNTAGQTFMRGYQISDQRGNVKFTSIYPGWYSGRTVHIHVRIRVYPNNDPTQTPTYDYESQLFFDDMISDHVFANVSAYNRTTIRDTYNRTDNIYLGGSLDADGVTSNAGALTTLKLAENKAYVNGAFGFILNLSLAEPTGNNGGGGPGGPPPGGGGTGGPPPGGGPGGPPPGG